MSIARTSARAALALAAALVLLAAVLLAVSFRDQALATHEPADHVAAAASDVVEVGPGAQRVLLSERIRTSAPADLLLQLTAECGVFFRWNETPPADRDDLRGVVRVWIEIDGVPVPVQTPGDDGRVSLCDRFFDRRAVRTGNIESVQSNELQANGFNWIRVNASPGLHEVVVKADLIERTREADNDVTAFVGRRTLIVEPVKMPVDQSVDPVTP